MDDLIAKIKARDDAYNEVEGTIALDDDYEQCAADRRALLGELAEALELLANIHGEIGCTVTMGPGLTHALSQAIAAIAKPLEVPK